VAEIVPAVVPAQLVTQQYRTFPAVRFCPVPQVGVIDGVLEPSWLAGVAGVPTRATTTPSHLLPQPGCQFCAETRNWLQAMTVDAGPVENVA
jgi:hypothetical protein